VGNSGLKIVNVADLTEGEKRELKSGIPNLQLLEREVEFWIGTYQLKIAEALIPNHAADVFRKEMGLTRLPNLDWLALHTDGKATAEFLWAIVKGCMPNDRPFSGADEIQTRMTIDQVKDNYFKAVKIAYLPSEAMSQESQDFFSIFVLGAGLPALADVMDMLKALPAYCVQMALNARNIEKIAEAVNKIAEAIGGEKVNLETMQTIQNGLTSETSKASNSGDMPANVDLN
jgi:hypothetical protein